jgi:2-dehydropantoate 2-reductase
MRILVVGAGAVGSYFGARLAKAGRDVTFLVRASRATQLRRDGLCVVSPHGDVFLTPKLIGAGEIYDLVLLSVKAYALEAAIDDFAPAVGPETMILPALNGMRHIDVLTQRFGDAAVLGGVCRVATEIDNGGRIVQLAEIQQLVYGERNGEVTPRLQSLDVTLRGAGFDANLSTEIIQAMWEKWVMLASLGAVTCLMRGAIGEVVAIPGGAGLSLQVLNECAAVGAACGHKTLGDLPVPTSCRDDGARVSSDVFDVPRSDQGSARRSRSHPWRSPAARRHGRGCDPFAKRRVHQSSDLSGWAPKHPFAN